MMHRFILAAVIAGFVCIASSAAPLRPHPANPRYFTDGSKNANGSLKVIYLTGSHTWNSLVDLWPDGAPPERFDFAAYLGFLERHGHNFIRLWTWDSTTWDTRGLPDHSKPFVHQAAPLPWARTGPGSALDGRVKFDLTRFDPDYFDRLRARVQAAGRRGIYVSVMLFEGWGLMHGNKGRAVHPGWAWRSHPFHPGNNINGIDPSSGTDGLVGDVHSLRHAEVNALQAAYLRKVVETVNDLDNVLFEVINEGGEPEWDWWVVGQVRAAEQALPRQHPIGITGHGAENLASMLASPADWISPGSRDGFRENPPAWDGAKISILDTDHIWGLGGSAGWVWKSLLRGHNPIFMDPYDGAVLTATAKDHRWESVRRALGAARRMAERIDLAAMTPQPKLASTEYCLAASGVEYLVFQPKPGEEFTLELPVGTYEGVWFDPQREIFEPVKVAQTRVARRTLRANFDGAALLHLKRIEGGSAK